jgi:RNA polymerase sigma factor (TIGR02999 family)
MLPTLRFSETRPGADAYNEEDSIPDSFILFSLAAAPLSRGGVSVMSDITGLLKRCWTDEAARKELWELVYGRLHLIAEARVHEWPNLTLQATELVNEAYIKIFDGQPVAWEHRARFFIFVSRVMKNFLHDYHRRKTAQKRNRGQAAAPLHDAEAIAVDPDGETLLILDLLDELAAAQPLLALIGELHYCGGRTFEEIADILRETGEWDLTADQVENYWRLARAEIYRRLREV